MPGLPLRCAELAGELALRRERWCCALSCGKHGSKLVARADAELSLTPSARSTHPGASAAHWATTATSSCPTHALAATTTANPNPSS